MVSDEGVDVMQASHAATVVALQAAIDDAAAQDQKTLLGPAIAKGAAAMPPPELGSDCIFMYHLH